MYVLWFIVMASLFSSHSDINECDDPDTCHVNANCTDTIGSYECDCKTGFTGDGFDCSGTQGVLIDVISS